jgi:hypothetical protein
VKVLAVTVLGSIAVEKVAVTLVLGPAGDEPVGA